mgnify:CR=1 FL=1
MLVVGLIISLVLLRLLWIFYSPIIYNLFLGYELDRTLVLRKSEKNLLQSMGLNKLSNKILATNDDDPPSLKVGHKEHGNETSTSPNNNTNSNFSSREIEKYSKLKNREELVHELARAREEVQQKLMEISCLENMMFASEQDNSSSHSKQSHEESETQSNPNPATSNENYQPSQRTPARSSDKYSAENNQLADLEQRHISPAPSRKINEHPTLIQAMKYSL